MSYHTHLPAYARSYANASTVTRLLGPQVLEWMSWRLLRAVHGLADLTLATSPQVTNSHPSPQLPPTAISVVRLFLCVFVISCVKIQNPNPNESTRTNERTTRPPARAQIQEELVAHGLKKVAVWRKGIDVDRFHPRFRSPEARRALSGGEPDKPLLLFVGRLAVEKSIGALKGVLEACPGARLAIVGAGPAEAELRAHFAGTPTEFAGELQGAALSAAFASADVFVMPSETETLGFVVLEAMASGLPVVGVRAGGVPSLLADGSTGVLAEPGRGPLDPEGLAGKVRELLADPAARRRLGLAARAEAETWGWESATAHLRDVHYRAAAENFRWGFHRRAGGGGGGGGGVRGKEENEISRSDFFFL